MDKKDVEIQNLRTELNKSRKLLKGIKYSIDHIKVQPYDYGDTSESLLSEIKSRISELNLK
jgi:cAMP phosphodiesterase